MDGELGARRRAELRTTAASPPRYTGAELEDAVRALGEFYGYGQLGELAREVRERMDEFCAAALEQAAAEGALTSPEIRQAEELNDARAAVEELRAAEEALERTAAQRAAVFRVSLDTRWPGRGDGCTRSGYPGEGELEAENAELRTRLHELEQRERELAQQAEQNEARLRHTASYLGALREVVSLFTVRDTPGWARSVSVSLDDLNGWAELARTGRLRYEA